MNFVEIFLLAIGLCFDTLAVSVSFGISIKELKITHYFKIMLILAGVQAAFLCGGLFCGRETVELVSNFDHWIAFGLLTFLGVKMILEKNEDDEDNSKQNTTLIALLLAGVATSIDALFVGFGSGLINARVGLMTVTVFVVTAAAAFWGLFFGLKLKKFGCKFNIIGGVILILIGIKILIEHFCK